MHKLLRPRHLIATGLVFLLASGALLGSAYASSDGEDAPEGPASIAIPLPAQGDRGRYVLERVPDATISSRYTNHPERPTIIDFHWDNDRRQPNATGVLQTFNVLHVETPTDYPYTFNATHLVEPGTAMGKAHEGTRLGLGLPGEAMFPLDLLTEPYHDGTALMRWFRDEPLYQDPICYRSGFQGSKLATTEIQRDLLGCGNGARDGWVRVEPVATYESSEGTVVVTHTYDGDYDLPSMRITWREGLAYPILQEIPQNGPAGPEWLRWRLTHFVPGSDPIATDPEPGEQLLVERTPRTPWILDETGLDHPFPPSEAYAAAIDDPDFSDLRDFIASHPDAYMAWLRGTVFDDENERSHRWEFYMTDGSEGIPVTVYRRPAVALGIVPLDNTYETEASRAGSPPFEVDPSAYLSPDELPAEMPTVASLAAMWEAQRVEPTPGPLTWDAMMVRDMDGAGGTPGLYVSVGITHGAWNRTLFSPNGYEWRDDTAGWYDDLDRMSVYTALATTQGSRLEAADEPVPATEADPVALQVVEFGGGLTPQQAAGLTFGALFLAILYWLSPLLKAGPTALFSRIQPEAVLEHPRRREIMEQVEARPGIHQSELLRRLGGGKGSLDQHLRRLEQAGVLRCVRQAGVACYFPKGKQDHSVQQATAYVTGDAAARILQAVVATPGITAVQLAAHTGLAAPTISYHVRRLQDAGLLERRRAGRTVRLSGTTLAERVTAAA